MIFFYEYAYQIDICVFLKYIIEILNNICHRKNFSSGIYIRV